MKKLIYIVFSILVFSSCTIEGMRDNGKLTGFWHLERIDTIPTGGAKDMSSEKIFWAVENKMLQLRGGTDVYSLRFADEGDSLFLSDPYLSLGHEEGDEGGDTKLTDAQGMHQYGIQHLEEHFLKETLKSNRMVLRTDSFRLYFKKF